MATDCVVVNSGRIVHETVDGEVIIIDLETGAYFSLKGSGELLWPAIVEGTTRDRLVGLLSNIYEGDPPGTESAVTDFLESLQAEAIVRWEPLEDAVPPAAPPAAGRAKGPFEPPRRE